MKTYALTCEQWVDRPLREVFSFFERPENLARITPPSLGFLIETPSPIAMHAGTTVDYTIRLAGFPIHWQSRITAYTPPYGFVDEQVEGPYRLWIHRHTFEERQGRTRVIDEVRYALRGEPWSALIHAVYVKRHLANIFDYRRRQIETLFPAR